MDWRAGRFSFDVGPFARPLVMGIINVTPDSFSDGGQHFGLPAAINHAERLLAEGADMLDIGGESTRPGAPPVPLDEERRRVLPVVEALAARGACISVDTRHPAIMREAIAAGASIINDVQALTAPGAIEACAAADVGVVLMHMQGTPGTMQAAPSYEGEGGVVGEVNRYLRERAHVCEQGGMARSRIVLDPGFGFGKTTEHNLELTRRLNELVALGYPVLAGWSRKRTLGELTGRKIASDRVYASVAAALTCVSRGARIVRVHDVTATVDALRVWGAMASHLGQA
ncbi:MAG: dihydropteroate synthase [Burkholderiales bacterium]|nr:dihydropteroate synthase [Burkholderiales bacterium]